jgi:hypothetical protein
MLTFSIHLVLADEMAENEINTCNSIHVIMNSCYNSVVAIMTNTVYTPENRVGEMS